MMESSGTVSSDASEFIRKLSDYSSIIGDLNGVWLGKSQQSLLSQANSFISEYNVIQNQMASLSHACSEYERYESLRGQISEMETARANAVAANQSTTTIDNNLYNMNIDLNKIKDGIINALNTASSTTLEATPLSATISTVGMKVYAAGGSAANKAFVESLYSEVGKTIYDYQGLGFHDGQWCADFASEMLIEHGYNIPRCSVAGDGGDDYDIFYALRNNGSVVHLDIGAEVMGYSDSDEYDPSYSPQAGDVVLFNWDADWSTDHVGFVIQDNGDGTIETLEGNTSGDAGSSCVAIKNRERSLVYGYATPVPK